MKKLFVLIGIILLFLVMSGAFYSGYKYKKPVVVTKEKIKYKTVYRDYMKLDKQDCVLKLSEYDKAVPVLDVKFVDKVKDVYRFKASASLAERSWTRGVSVQVAENSNFKFYVVGGVLLAGGIVAGLAL